MGTNREEISTLLDNDLFCLRLYELMGDINSAVKNLAHYEFRYGLNNLTPENGWDSIKLENCTSIEQKIASMDFYLTIKTSPLKDKKIMLDEQIVDLCRMIFVGLVLKIYSVEWVNLHFTFDIRGFYFLPKTTYFTKDVIDHFGGKPYQSFRKGQLDLSYLLEIGYKEYKKANQEIDAAFIGLLSELIARKGTPILLTIAGPTAAGKTEIVERLSEKFHEENLTIASLEMDNFGKDREYRDTKKTGVETVHFPLFLQAIENLLAGKSARIPRYDFYNSTSSHDLDGKLRPGQTSLEVLPANIIFLEGNFPFHIPELSAYLGIKIVYLADDDIRFRRKWKRDIDYRKKYHPINFMNRYFRTQFIRAQEIYCPLMQVCDVVVDTSAANLWVTPDLMDYLNNQE